MLIQCQGVPIRLMKITRRRHRVLRAAMAVARDGEIKIRALVQSADIDLRERFYDECIQECHALMQPISIPFGRSPHSGILAIATNGYEIKDAASLAVNHWRHVFVFETLRCMKEKIKGSPLLITAKTMLAKYEISSVEYNGVEYHVASDTRQAEAAPQQVEAPQEA